MQNRRRNKPTTKMLPRALGDDEGKNGSFRLISNKHNTQAIDETALKNMPGGSFVLTRKNALDANTKPTTRASKIFGNNRNVAWQ
jgi:hypothetical protein